LEETSREATQALFLVTQGPAIYGTCVTHLARQTFSDSMRKLHVLHTNFVMIQIEGILTLTST